jgi:hypothetical protein
VTRRTASILAWTVVALSTVAGLSGTILSLAVEGAGWRFLVTEAAAIAVFFVSAVVGALVASRLPTNPIGWILLGLVASLALSGATDGYVVRAVDDGRLTGTAQWAALYASDGWLLLLAALFLLLLLFPDGRLPTRRWRVVLWAGAVSCSPASRSCCGLGRWTRIRA